MSYDRALTVFSADGRLLQLEYALEAVKRGTLAVAVRGEKVVVLGIERKNVAKLQEERTVRKINALDDHCVMTFAGLTADARVLVSKARLECQQYRLNNEVPALIRHVAHHVASVQQQYTQRGGRRPFGLQCIVAGHDPNTGEPHVFVTDPAGSCTEWKAACTGNKMDSVREFLEKNYREGMDEDAAVMLATRAVLETVETGSKNIQLCVLRQGQHHEILDDAKVEELCAAVEEEKQRKEQQRREMLEQASGVARS
ncbi:MAG: hypothetical protein MHM6MM_004246 [Cercozoa sp. M6MM]